MSEQLILKCLTEDCSSYIYMVSTKDEKERDSELRTLTKVNGSLWFFGSPSLILKEPIILDSILDTNYTCSNLLKLDTKKPYYKLYDAYRSYKSVDTNTCVNIFAVSFCPKESFRSALEVLGNPDLVSIIVI